MEGNGRDAFNDDFVSSSVEMDLYDAVIQEHDGNLSHQGGDFELSFFSNFSKSYWILFSQSLFFASYYVFEIDTGFNHSFPSQLNGPASNIRCFSTRRSGKRWKRRYYFQQKARQERLNNSRKQKCVSHSKLSPSKEDEDSKADNVEVPDSETCNEDTSEMDDTGKGIRGEGQSEKMANSVKDTDISSKERLNVENCSCASLDSTEIDRNGNNKGCDQDDSTSAEVSKSNSKWKRHSDRDLDSPKPRKSQRAAVDCARLSHKYSVFSFCSVEDRIPDGFYDAGRERSFLPLSSYEQNFQLDSREVILVDR